MVRREERTVELYLRVGALMRLLKDIASETMIEGSKVLSAKEMRNLDKMMAGIDRACSNAEDRMFADHPDLDDSYLRVFYGAIDEDPEEEIRKLAEKLQERLREAGGTCCA